MYLQFWDLLIHKAHENVFIILNDMMISIDFILNWDSVHWVKLQFPMLNECALYAQIGLRSPNACALVNWIDAFCTSHSYFCSTSTHFSKGTCCFGAMAFCKRINLIARCTFHSMKSRAMMH